MTPIELEIAPEWTPRVEALRARLGAERVDEWLVATHAVGTASLPGDEDLAFGFVQRVLMHLKNHRDRNCGMLFPKVDAEYRRFFDYFDGDGRIFLIFPGDGPDQMRYDPAWFRPMDLGFGYEQYYEVVPGAELAIVVAFLEAYAALQAAA